MELLSRLRATLAGRYEVIAEVGRGGMATVFEARDVRHDRSVAVKILDPELAAVVGAERFLSEIRVTAALQHPNLLPLFDSGEHDGHLYYVMPFVAGESLRVRLDRERQLSIDEAIRIATAIGNALDYAHSHGVVHRDLKPENILLQHGQPIVADFGIALAISKAGGSRITQTGLSLGTPQYMSPEQASGDRAIDGRSDIYALSAILYEMLAGETPHTGPTVQAIVAKVLTENPVGIRHRRPSVPENVERVLQRGLAKLPADRFATAQQFVDALNSPSTNQPEAVAGRPLRRARLATIGALAAASCLLVGWLVGRRVSPRSERIVRFDVALPLGTRFGSYFGALVGLSPDGKRLAYIGPPNEKGDVWVRDLDKDNGKVIGRSTPSYSPTFSPDGKWIYWYESSRLTWVKAPDGGGTVTSVLKSNGPEGFDWYTPDSLIFTTMGLDGGSQLLRTNTSGGSPKPFLLADSTTVSIAQWQPIVAPDGKTVFFVSRRREGSTNHDELAYATLDERRIHIIPIEARFTIGYAAGAIIYAQDNGAIMALPYDLKHHEMLDTPVPTNETAQVDAFRVAAVLSRGGDLVFQQGARESQMVFVSAGGATQPLSADRKQFSFPRYSPDGRRIAYSLFDGVRTDVWIYSIESKSPERLTSNGTDNQRPEWTPDGRYVIYRSNESGEQALYRKRVDGSGPAERLTPPLNFPVHEGVVSPDGQTLLYRVDGAHARDMYTIPFGQPTATPQLFLGSDFDELTPRFSPNGKWVAYVSNESGRDEVYVRPFPGPGGRALISTGGGNEPVWSPDGQRLYYRSNDAVVAARVTLSGGPSVQARDTVLSGAFILNRFHPMYDVARDGRLLMLQAGSNQLLVTVILNWADGLADRLKKRD